MLADDLSMTRVREASWGEKSPMEDMAQHEETSADTRQGPRNKVTTRVERQLGKHATTWARSTWAARGWEPLL